MQEVDLTDGRRIREFMSPTEGIKPYDSLGDMLREKYLSAMAQYGSEIQSIRQVQIDRDDFCPCGSGKIFKRCCEGKVNMGPEEVAPNA